MVADINPCGAVVDYIRRSYRTTARPFRDSDETAEIVWYPALPDAPTLPFPTTFNSGDWNPNFIDKTSPGEVYDAPRPFVYEEPKPHALGRHQCGTAADFVEGVPYDPEQIVPYNDDGLPVCCSAWERGPCGCGAAGATVTVVPPPGQTCATAIEHTPIPGGGYYDVPYTAGQNQAWVTFVFPVGTTFQVRVEGSGTRVLYSGGNCGTLFQRGFFAGSLPVTFFQVSSFGRYYVLWDDPAPGMRIWIPYP